MPIMRPPLAGENNRSGMPIICFQLSLNKAPTLWNGDQPAKSVSEGSDWSIEKDRWWRTATMRVTGKLTARVFPEPRRETRGAHTPAKRPWSGSGPGEAPEKLKYPAQRSLRQP